MPRFGGHSEILEIGRGGMAVVYLARAHSSLRGFDKLVVLKALSPIHHGDAHVREMFLEEARLAAKLNHANIVQTLACGETDDVPYMVMEHLDGCSLRVLERRLRPRLLPQTLALAIVAEALAGLDYAHELWGRDGKPLGIVHRDVTPQNVFVTVDGRVKLIDFGIAKSVERPSVTEDGVLKGCLPYMAPEQARGEPIDRRIDIYAMGVILRELVTGERLWARQGEVAILRALGEGHIPSFRDSNVASAIREVCERAMAPNPEDRYTSAAAMRAAIHELIAAETERGSSDALGALVERELEHDRARVRAAVAAHFGDDEGASMPPTRIVAPSTGQSALAPAIITRQRPSAFTQERFLTRAVIVAGLVFLACLIGVVGWSSRTRSPTAAASPGVSVAPAQPELPPPPPAATSSAGVGVREPAAVPSPSMTTTIPKRPPAPPRAPEPSSAPVTSSPAPRASVSIERMDGGRARVFRRASPFDLPQPNRTE